MPQSSPLAPLSGYGPERAGTDGRNRSPSLRPSLSAMGSPFSRRGAGGGSVVGAPGGKRPRRYAGRPPERVEQAILGQFEHPRVDLQPPGVAVVVSRDGRWLWLERRRALA